MKGKWFQIHNSTNSAEIFIYDYIGMGEEGIRAKDFVAELTELENRFPIINIRINSGGGSMMEGIPIYNFIKKSKAHVNIYIDGIAASMAAVIAMAGKKIYMASNARLMTHEPSNIVAGNSKDLREAADLMDSMRSDVADVLCARSGKDKKYVLDKWLLAGTDKWFTAAEALAENLIDEIYDAGEQSPKNHIAIENLVAHYQPTLESKFFNQPNPTMKKVIAALNASNVVKLPDTATEELVAEGLTTLSNQLSNKDQIIATKDAEIKRLGDEATAASKKGLADKATALVENALTAQKIVATQKENFVKLAAASEDSYSAVKAMLDSMKGYTPISQQLGAGKSTTDLKAEFTKLATEGGLDTLKAENFEHFKAVYKAGTGKEFKD